jgi:hypothetical protein
MHSFIILLAVFTALMALITLLWLSDDHFG